MKITRHNQKATRTSRTFVPNSSDHENDNPLEAEPINRTASTRRVLKEVSIPIIRKATSARGKQTMTEFQPIELESSNGSPSLENSDNDTAATSISTTPATSIRRGKMAAQKSGLSKAVTASLSSSSTRKRSRTAVLDSEEDDDTIDADAELALQIQMEEDDSVHQNKRLKLDAEEDGSESMVFTSGRKGRTSHGRNKGKARLENYDSDSSLSEVADSLLNEIMTPPIKGKGKGKGKHIKGRPARASARKSGFIEDIEEGFMSLNGSDGEDFQPEIAESVLSDLETPAISDSDEEPLAALSARLKKAGGKSSKAPRGKKKVSRADKIANNKRRARWAHIEDKWDRKRAMNRERAEQQHPKLLSMWKTLEEVPVLEVQQAEQPQSISRRLKPFQLEGLSWMIRQEKTHYKGGLLGDEMGMGKTIQAVSLIMSDYPAKEPTLVCVPPVALMQWSNEIREYTDNKLKVLVYHGTNAKCKKMSVKELRSYDVIMVSYNSLESLHRKETKGWSRGEDIIKEASPLHAIKYHRLILDEAHSIKSRNTGVAKACFALKGDYKWCLSGTPVQNRIGEFFSLLRFLEVRPFADYFCRSCDCEKLHWATDDDHMCVACNHGASEHISVFNQELLNPITGDDPALREDALTKLHMITARIMLRRMKRDHTNSMVSLTGNNGLCAC